MANPTEILQEVLSEYKDSNKWENAPFGHIKRISNTLVGSVGQAFIERLCKDLGFECGFPIDPKGKRSKNSPWDIQIEKVKFELKTATEDVNGNFQFNHVRYHRHYDALLCVGIGPSHIHFGVWSKADVTTGKAGALVSMEKGTNASHKLTKKPENLRPIDQFSNVMSRFTTEFST